MNRLRLSAHGMMLLRHDESIDFTLASYGCPVPQLPPPGQHVDILGGIGELVRLGNTNTS